MLIENNLKQLRELKDITQEELGKTLGVTKGTVSNWENGNDSIPLKQLIKICNLYDVSIDYLLCISRANKTYSKIKDSNIKTIGKSIKKIRINLNLTQEKFSKDLDIGRSTLSKIENNSQNINTLTLQTLCLKFKVSADELFGRK